MKCVPAIALVLVILPAAPILADEARIPIFQPTTITQPGYYILTRDLSPASVTAITIQADNVTVDLNGRAINSAPSQGAIAVNGAFQNVTIRNGRLLGGDFGVNAVASAPGTVNLRVERVEIRNTAFVGVQVFGAGIVQLISCRITDSGGDATYILPQTGGTAFTGQFIDNVIDNVGRFGLDVGGGRGVEVRGNVITRFGTTTPRVFGLILGSGFGGGGGNIVEGNVVRGSDDDIGILEENRQRQRFGLRRRLERSREFDGHDLPGLDRLIRFGVPPGDAYAAFLDQPLNVRSRSIGENGRQEAIEPDAVAVVGNGDVNLLIG